MITAIAMLLVAQPPYEGLWKGYDPEWGHVSRQLAALAEAIPEEKYGWRPAPGVRSVSEVVMHTAISNLYLLAAAGGPKMPAEIQVSSEKNITAKADAIKWLRRSLDAVRDAHAKETAKTLNRKVWLEGAKVETNADGMYLRIIVHANEHMGQLIAYARMAGVKPPWSE